MKQIHRDTGNRIGEAVVLSNLGSGWLKLGNLAQAGRDLDAALRMLRANGDRTIEGAALTHLSVLALWQGDGTRALSLASSALDIAVASKARDKQAFAGLCLGDAELLLGRTSAARLAYSQSHAVALEIDDVCQHDASAGMVRVALAQSDAPAAMGAVQPLLEHIAAGGTLDGTEDPRLIELTCHHTLARAGDPRAADMLARAHTALMAQADAISDPTLRHGFLHNIPITARSWRRGRRRLSVTARDDLVQHRAVVGEPFVVQPALRMRLRTPRPPR